MCHHSDLFGDVIVTVDEVNIWLDATANIHNSTLASRNYHVKHCDTANQT
nr:hypothetical protein [uncultured Methylotenera sp.]